MKTNLKSIVAIALALMLSIFCMTGCGASNAAPQSTQPVVAATNVPLANGGTILLSVNPEIAIDYDNDGFVTGITAKNDDAFKVLANYSGFTGKQAHKVVAELVSEIGEAGYFVEEVEGQRRQIILEIEPGSAIPSNRFVDDVVNEVQKVVNANNWQAPLDVRSESDYGTTDYNNTNYGGNTNYDDTDYGPNNDGVTDYDHNINDGTDYGDGSDGITDYDGTDYANNTDYGVNADGNTDYNDSDYGVWGDGVTDYDGNDVDYSDYGEGSDGITDYDGTDYDANTDYGVNNDGNTDYSDTDYGPSGDGNTDYDDDGDSGYVAPAPTPAPAPSYGGGDSGYSNYGGGGDSGYSGYGES